MGMEKTVEAIRNYVAGFLDSNVKSDAPRQPLAGISSEYPDVDVVTETPSACKTRHREAD